MMLIEFYVLKQIPEIIVSLSKILIKNRADQKLLVFELKRNLKQFENAAKIGLENDKLIKILSNNAIKKAQESGFVFSLIKFGKIKNKHIKDRRNHKYKGKDCEWLFLSISDKIEELKGIYSVQKLGDIKRLSLNLQFSNLFYKMKLLAEFIR